MRFRATGLPVDTWGGRLRSEARMVEQTHAASVRAALDLGSESYVQGAGSKSLKGQWSCSKPSLRE